MRDLFPGYYAPEDFQQLWSEATFVLDANVLLNLYRFPKAAANDLLGALEKIADRLWLPHQAAMEYQRNRLSVIRQQREQFKNVRDALDRALADLTGSFEQFQLKKRHSTIDPKPLLTKTDELFEQFKAELDGLENTQPDVSDRDEIRERVDKLLSGRIGSPPKSQGELDQIYAEGKERYGYGRPPGYKDTDKSRDQTTSVYFLNNLRFEREYGDLILWKQILQHCKQNEVQHLIFVIDDKKQDWWLSIGGKRIGARPEITDEITSEGGTKTFHMYDSERFLEFAKDYLEEQVKQESIVQIRDVIEANEANRVEAIRSIRSATFQEQAIRSWLGRAHPNSTITGQLGLIRERYVVRNPDGVRMVYEVQFAPDAFIYSTLKEKVQRANAQIHNGEFDTFTVILVLPDATLASELRETIQRMPDVHGPRVSFIISTVLHGIDESGAERGALNVLHEFLGSPPSGFTPPVQR
jgi:hypothetical protein